MTRPRVLVVDDRTTMVELVGRVLDDLGEVVVAAGVGEALGVLERDRVDAVVCDLRLPDGSGLDVLRASRLRSPAPPFILMTAFASVDTAVAAMRGGAYDYVSKPFDPEDLRGVVEGALSRADLERTRGAGRRLGMLVGQSRAMQSLFDRVRRVAPTDVVVLIRGEAGTGKELVARALHALSGRAAKPFVAIDCTGMPRDLLEPELFGHAKGALPGADADRAGLLETAQGGTLFLDDVADLSRSLQGRLTRVLERDVVRRVGDPEERPVDVRVVVSTRHDLSRAVAERRFREDLHDRLSACPLEVPPLRARAEDIPVLAQHFLAERGPLLGAHASDIAPDAMERLVAYPWPGNVRELRSVVERAALLEPTARIEPESLPAEVRGDPDAPPVTDAYLARIDLRQAQELARDEMNRRYLTIMLRKHGGDVAATAAAAKVERESVYRLLRRYGLSAGSYREGQGSRRRRGSGEVDS